MLYKNRIKAEDFLESLKNSLGDSSQNHLTEQPRQDCLSTLIYMILLTYTESLLCIFSTVLAFTGEYHRMSEQVCLCKPLG